MKRLYKEGLITTLIGLGIIVFSGAMIWTGKESAEAMSGWIGLGLMFLRSKDSIIGITDKEK